MAYVADDSRASWVLIEAVSTRSGHFLRPMFGQLRNPDGKYVHLRSTNNETEVPEEFADLTARGRFKKAPAGFPHVSMSAAAGLARFLLASD